MVLLSVRRGVPAVGWGWPNSTEVVFKWDQFTGALEKQCKFGFSSRADYHFEDGGKDEDRRIDDLGVAVAIAKEDVSRCSAAGFWSN